MALFTEDRARTRARNATAYKGASVLFSERMKDQVSISQPHIFLSHSFDDKELLLGVVLLIEDLGYEDRKSGKAAIIPIVDYSTENYRGQQFLGVYPYVAIEKNRGGNTRLWIHNTNTCYVEFSAWLAGESPTEH